MLFTSTNRECFSQKPDQLAIRISYDVADKHAEEYIHFKLEQNSIESMLMQLQHVLSRIVCINKQSIQTQGTKNNEASTVFKHPPLYSLLTKRELQVLALLPKDLSHQEIANQLFISLGTLKWHLSNIYDKLQVNNRVAAINKIQQLNLREP